MKKITSIVFAIFLLVSCGENTKIGKYTKEPLPENFTYEIVKDESNEALEKNQLSVELSAKLTESQIATIAEELFNYKDKQRRFYISYNLKGIENTSTFWAISNFDPELEIEIIGSTIEQDKAKDKLLEKVDGEVIGIWNENKYTYSNLLIFKKDNKTFLKTIYKSGQVSDVELTESKNNNGTRYDYKDGGYNGEYFVLNKENNLELYNKENKNYTTAMRKK